MSNSCWSMSRDVDGELDSAVQLLIMRHGAAEMRSVTDDSRPLTAAGEAEALAVARFLAGEGLVRPSVCHSPYVRARQTAAIVCRHIGSESTAEHADLTPDSDPRRAGQVMQAGSARVLLCVAHQPLVGRMVSWLVDGDPQAGRFFATGGIALLRCAFPGPEGSSLLWYREPGELP